MTITNLDETEQCGKNIPGHDPELVERLIKTIAAIESDEVELICVSGLSRDEYLSYLLGVASAETMAKITTRRFSDTID